jgi:hypothetical protein
MFYQVITYTLIYLQIDRVTDNQFVRLVSIVFILLMAINNYSRTSAVFNYSKLRTPFMLFVLMIILSLLITSSPVSNLQNIIYSISIFLTDTFFIVTSIAYLLYKKKFDGIDVITYTSLYPLGLFVGLNLLLWVLGVKVTNEVVIENTTGAVMLSAIGIHMDRVIFPLSGGGLNTYGDLVGALLMIAIVVSIFRFRLINLLIFAITLISILLVDNRSFLVNAVLASLGVYFLSKRKSFKYLKNLPILLIIGPFLLLLYLPVLYASVSSSILRPEETTDTLLRVIVWTKSVLYLSDFKIMHIFGYGEYGHYASGVSKQWAFLFKDWKSPDYVGPHSTLFSIIFDYGYIGVLIYFVVIRGAIKDSIIIWKANADQVLPVCVVGFWAYYLISGCTEALNGFYSPSFIFVFEIMILLPEIFKLSLNQAAADDDDDEQEEIEKYKFNTSI